MRLLVAELAAAWGCEWAGTAALIEEAGTALLAVALPLLLAGAARRLAVQMDPLDELLSISLPKGEVAVADGRACKGVTKTDRAGGRKPC